MKQLSHLLFAGTFLMFAACNGSKAIGEGSKESKTNLQGTYWKLTELNGKPVIMGDNDRELYLTLDAATKRVAGNGGCNGFGGGYELNNNGFNIKFTQLIRTQMACEAEGRMNQENEFLKIIEMADSYYVNGDQLQLNKGRMAPLAKFTAKQPKSLDVLQ